MKRFITILNIALSLFAALAPMGTHAIATYDKVPSINDTIWYDPRDYTASCGASPATGGPSGSGTPSGTQVQHAQTIIGIAKTLNLGKQGALIGLMVALTESTLKNQANDGTFRNNNGVQPYINTKLKVDSLAVPHDAVGHDNDSVGLFQQRAIDGSWGPVSPTVDLAGNIKWLMTPAYAAEAFFAMPAGKRDTKALTNISGWQTMDPATAAQMVQGSGTSSGSNYRRQQSAAQALVDKYYDSSPAIPLPVPLAKGGAAAGGAAASTGSSACPSASTTATAGPITGCTNPITDPRWRPARTDQGVDYTEDSNIPVKAICDGTVLETSGSGWPGGYFIMIKISSGPYAGKCTYVAEHLSNVIAVGSKVTAGQTIATTLPGYPWTEWGWAAGPQTPSTRGADVTPGGEAFARFLRHLGAKTLANPGAGPEYAGASCK